MEFAESHRRGFVRQHRLNVTAVFKIMSQLRTHIRRVHKLNKNTPSDPTTLLTYDVTVLRQVECAIAQ
jgi:hypothetical protein